MRLEKLIFVAVMAIFMVAPLLQMVVPFAKMPPLDEFRTLAVAPDLVGKITHGDGRIAAGVNAWFDDHAGFRPILTRLANQINYSIFSYSKKVLIGRNGWLFDPAISNRAIINARAGDSALAALFEKMLRLADFLKLRNIRLVVISTPAKETVYSDLLPLGTPRGPVPTPFQRFRTFLQERDGRDWIHIDSQALVTRRPQNVDLYLRTDPHMTVFGNFLIAKEMVNRIAEAEGVEWRWNDDINTRREEWSNGTYVRFLSLFTVLTEIVSNLNPRYDFNAQPPGEYFETTPAKPFETIYHNETGRATLPRTVMFGSSFVDWYVALGAHSNFKDFYRTRGTADLMGDTLNAIPEGTRYFIFQFWEPHYSAFAGAKIPVD